MNELHVHTCAVTLLLLVNVLNHNQAKYSEKQIFGSEWKLHFRPREESYKGYYEQKQFCANNDNGVLASFSYKEFLGLKNEWFNHIHNHSFQKPIRIVWYVWLGIRRRRDSIKYYIDDGRNESVYQLPWLPGHPPQNVDLSTESCVMLRHKREMLGNDAGISQNWIEDRQCGDHAGALCRRDNVNECKSAPCPAWLNCVDMPGGYVCEEPTTPGPTASSSNTTAAVTHPSSYTIRQMFGSEWLLFLNEDGERNYFHANDWCNEQGYGSLATMTWKEYIGLTSDWFSQIFDNETFDGFDRHVELWLGIRRRAGGTEFYFEDGRNDTAHKLPWYPGYPVTNPDLSTESCVMLILDKQAHHKTKIYVKEKDCVLDEGGAVCRRDIVNECQSSPCKSWWLTCVDLQGGYVCEERKDTDGNVRDGHVAKLAADTSKLSVSERTLSVGLTAKDSDQ